MNREIELKEGSLPRTSIRIAMPPGAKPLPPGRNRITPADRGIAISETKPAATEKQK